MVQIAILYFGLYYQAGKKDDFVKGDGIMWCFFSLILIICIYFVVLFILNIRFEMMKATVKNNSICFRIFSCGRIKDKKVFIKENKVGEL